jgi:hypothetical protein
VGCIVLGSGANATANNQLVIAGQMTGTVVLAAGTLVVPALNVTASTRIFLTSQVGGGTPGFLRVSTRTAGTSFTILSSSVTDTSTVAYLMIEP